MVSLEEVSCRPCCCCSLLSEPCHGSPDALDKAERKERERAAVRGVHSDDEGVVILETAQAEEIASACLREEER